ncbi:MAG: peroxide stress protein YaaA [Paludibacter sp.]
MLIILSPAKIQNFAPQQLLKSFTQPEFLNEAETLVNEMRQLSAFDLSKLLGINSNLSQLNADRYFNWHRPFTPENAKQAVLVFNGEVFHGLDASSFSEDDFVYLQSHLRILSGLYGILRPLDLIQPYRLEISTKLQTSKGKNLYAFWGEQLTNSVNKAVKASGQPKVILNLASGEYFNSMDRKLLKTEVIDFEFLEIKGEDEYKSNVMYTKKARGLMARYIIDNRIQNVDDLKGFSAEDYWFSEKLSSNSKFVFTRETLSSRAK